MSQGLFREVSLLTNWWYINCKSNGSERREALWRWQERPREWEQAISISVILFWSSGFRLTSASFRVLIIINKIDLILFK
jgi:hypothetical protein